MRMLCVFSIFGECQAPPRGLEYELQRFWWFSVDPYGHKYPLNDDREKKDRFRPCGQPLTQNNSQFPLDTSPLHGISTTPAEQIRFTLVNVSIPTRSATLRICSVPVRSPPAQIRRTPISGGCRSTTQQQLNLALSRQEIKRYNNKQHPDTFQNKTPCVDTSTQISQKRQTQALLLNLRSETLCVIVFNNTDQ